MNGKKPVLVTTDGSAHSHRVLPHAGLLAKALGAPVLLLQVLEDSSTEVESARSAGAATLERLGIDGEARVEARQSQEKPAATILRVAQEVDAAVLAMDSRGHGALRHVLHGSVALEVLQTAELPLLVSGPNLEPAEQEARPYRIVATSDGSSASEALLHQLSLLSEGADLKVTLFRVHEHEPGHVDNEAAVEICRSELEAACRMLPESLSVEMAVRDVPRGAGIDTAITEKAQEVGAHAIAMSTHGHSARRHVVAGSVALTLLGRSPLPLLLARANV